MSSGDNYWPGSGIANSMPDDFPVLESAASQAHRMHRIPSYDSSEVQSAHSVNSSSSGDEQPQMTAQFGTPQVATLVIRPHASADQALKAPLAPKQGLGGPPTSSKTSQLVSPISGTYALRTPRGKITSIACESCRKRKSKVINYLILMRAPKFCMLTAACSAMAFGQDVIPAKRRTSPVFLRSSTENRRHNSERM